MTEQKSRQFWDRFAERYAARPVKDIAAYEALIANVAARLNLSDSVLEIGCGTGGTAIRLAAGVDSLIATDVSPEMIRIARAKPAPANLSFVAASASNAFYGGPFDAICAFNVLHLVDDVPALLTRIHANLKPGGLLISKTWCFADTSLKLRFLFGALRLVRLFPPATFLTVEQLRTFIAAAGFEVVEERRLGAYEQNPYIVARVKP